MTYQSIQVRFQGPICFLQLHRPEANNAIDETLIREFRDALARCEEQATIVVVEGLPEVFCVGADFRQIGGADAGRAQSAEGPDALYDVWTKLATGPYVSVAHVRGKANAGGMGFVSACDVVVADESA